MNNLLNNRISNQRRSINKGQSLTQQDAHLSGHDIQIASTSPSGKKCERRLIRIPKVNSANAFLSPLIAELADSVRQFNEQIKEDINDYYTEKERETAGRELQMLQYEDDSNNNNNNNNSNNNNNNNNSNPNGNMQMNSVLYESKFQDSYLEFNCHRSEEECDEDINEPIRNQNNQVDLNSFIKFPQQQVDNDFKEEDSLLEICKHPEYDSNNNNNNNNINQNEVPAILTDIKNLLFSIPIKIASLSHLMHEHHIITDSLFIPQGKYCKYSSEVKKQFVSMTKTYGLNTVASSFNLSTKTLKRWINCGTKRKDGGGRKELDPEMEDKLYEWYIDNREIRKITPTMLKKKAREYSNCSHFKASKGWYTKFVKKYKINLKEDEKKLRPKKETISNQNKEDDSNDI